VSQDFTEVANVYQAFSTKGAAARYRDEVEGFTAFEVIGPVDGQSVLDLACGFGRYGLALARRGAARGTSRRAFGPVGASSHSPSTHGSATVRTTPRSTGSR
jgi:hypothetical protein